MYPPLPPIEAPPDPDRPKSCTYRYEWGEASALRVVKVGHGQVPITDGLREAIENDTTRRLLKGSGH
jgi:hypothetical protein